MKQWIITIPAARVAEANLFCRSIAEGGEKTFTNGLSSDGKSAAEYYWCCWTMTDDIEAQLRAGLPFAVFVEKFTEGDGYPKGVRKTPYEVLSENSLKKNIPTEEAISPEKVEDLI